MLHYLLTFAQGFKRRLDRWHLERRWARLRALGMHIGYNVSLPASTWIDESHCFLISVGDHCGFGERCMILAHDAQMNEFLHATRVGKIIIHPSTHIGAGTVILPGVEIGPRTIVAAGSTVSRSLPPDTFCAGSPARAVGSLEEYLQNHRRQLRKRPQFLYDEYKDIRVTSPQLKTAMRQAVTDGDAYIVPHLQANPSLSASPPDNAGRSHGPQ